MLRVGTHISPPLSFTAPLQNTTHRTCWTVVMYIYSATSFILMVPMHCNVESTEYVATSKIRSCCMSRCTDNPINRRIRLTNVVHTYCTYTVM